MKLPDGMTHGYFDMATPDGFLGRRAYLIGPFAIHGRPRDWKLSHAPTGYGIPYAYADTLAEAASLARHIEGVIDWSRIRRGKSVCSQIGMTKAKGRAVREAILAWRESK